MKIRYLLVFYFTYLSIFSAFADDPRYSVDNSVNGSPHQSGVPSFTPKVPNFKPMFRPDGGDTEIPLPAYSGVYVIVDGDMDEPFEPNILEVEFRKLQPPVNISERVERMVHGITVDQPPEYDRYGYDLRRFMQKVGNSKIYTDLEFLTEQISNLKKADIVLDFWRRKLQKEILEMEPMVEKDDVSLPTKTAFKQNMVHVNNFLIAAQDWVTANEKFLEYLSNIHGSYEYIYPEFTFDDAKKADKFARLLMRRQQAIRTIREYTIFRLMVY